METDSLEGREPEYETYNFGRCSLGIRRVKLDDEMWSAMESD